MIHPDTKLEFINEQIGMGVFATKLIPKGTITWVRDDLDLVIPITKLSLYPEILQTKLKRYIYYSADGYILNWDISRYINHSCDPNMLGTYNFEIAIRDILPGEEIVDDYSVYCMDENDMFICGCGKKNCRGQIRPDDYLRQSNMWDSLYFPAFQCIPKVIQPLMPLVKDIKEIENGIRDPSTILTHRELTNQYAKNRSNSSKKD